MGADRMLLQGEVSENHPPQQTETEALLIGFVKSLINEEQGA